jgi:glycine/D-amino acid oxidase-like deaminating enzyme
VSRARGPVGQIANGGVSFWHSQLEPVAPRAPLPGPIGVDVAIVGGGLTGLWTAYYLKRAQPSLRVAVLEQRFAGFGASGRNGGWLTATVAGSLARYSRARGVESATALQRAMINAVDEVIAVCAAEGIEADIVKGGVLRVAHTEPQLHRLRAAMAAEVGWGDPHTFLDAEEVRDRVNVAGVRGGSFSPHGARLHPAKFVRGLAAVVVAAGVELYEGTRALALRPHEVVTDRGTVSATHVVRATEGFTANFAGHHRRWLPMNSSMIITEPLGNAAWEAIGWRGAEVLGDSAHTFMYAQRTADGRIAIGGRGVPYRYGSRFDADGATPQVTIDQLRHVVTTYFPGLADVRIDHAWSGVLGVPRDWCATVEFDPATGLASAGGYVGHGVTTTNLAGRTLCDLLLGRESDLTALPWVGWRARTWEPEPLRWLGVRALYLAYRAADRLESTEKAATSVIARAADLISGR